MRASDDDRQRAVDELRRHCAAGRIDVDEYATRVERVLTASTLDEIEEVRADLPMLRVPEPSGAGVWAGRATGAGASTALRIEGAARRAGSHGRLRAVFLAALAVMVVLAVIGLTLAAEWTWAVILVAGWAAGMLQGRLARGGRRGP